MIEIKKHKKIPILVGGSGLYLNAVINGLVPIPSISQETKNECLLKFNQVGIEKFRKMIFEIDPLYKK